MQLRAVGRFSWSKIVAALCTEIPIVRMRNIRRATMLVQPLREGNAFSRYGQPHRSRQPFMAPQTYSANCYSKVEIKQRRVKADSTVVRSAC